MEESAKPSVTTMSSGIRFGLILSIVSIAYFLILTTLGINSSQGVWSWLMYLVYAGFIFLAQKYFKDNGDSFMSYGQGIGISFWLGLISTVVYMVFFYIYVKFIDAGFIQMIKDAQLEQMQSRGMRDEQIDQAMSISGKFMTPEVFLISGLIIGILGMVVIGLIVTIFTQKKNPEPFA